jgi:hypothetical protein
MEGQAHIAHNNRNIRNILKAYVSRPASCSALSQGRKASVSSVSPFVFPSYVLLDPKPRNRYVQMFCSPSVAYALTRSVSSAAGADVLRAKGQGTTSQPSHGYPHHSIELGFERSSFQNRCRVAGVELPRSFDQRASQWKG